MSNEALLLVAHGSADRRAGATTRALARSIAAVRPGIDVGVSFLDHAGPRPAEALFALSRLGHRSAAVVPLLLTAAYHGRVDLPGALAKARADGLTLDAAQTDVLGPVDGARTHPLLLKTLKRRLAETNQDYDGVVLIAAGTRDDTARDNVYVVAADLGEELKVPCRAGFASASPLTAGLAVEDLRGQGCRRIAIASYFLACGRLYDTAVASARHAGALKTPAEPLGSAFDVARLVLERADSVTYQRA
jgi:sirohydrochlorin ferrochelatase